MPRESDKRISAVGQVLLVSSLACAPSLKGSEAMLLCCKPTVTSIPEVNKYQYVDSPSPIDMI